MPVPQRWWALAKAGTERALAALGEVLRAGGMRKPLMQQAGIDMNSLQPIHDAVVHAGTLGSFTASDGRGCCRRAVSRGRW